MPVVSCNDTTTVTGTAGGNQQTVPDVVGQTQANGEATLTGAGFTTSDTSQCDNAVAAGNIISQNPAGGSQATTGSNVAIVVSTGPCPAPQNDLVRTTPAAGAFTPAQLAAIEDGRNQLNAIFAALAAPGPFRGDPAYDGVNVDVEVADLGNMSTLAQGGPDMLRGDGTPLSGTVTFNSQRLAGLSPAQITSTFKHEAIHVLTLAWVNSPGVCAGDQNTGANAVAQYASYGGAGNVPSQPGSNCGHLDEAVFDTELMTPIADSPTDPISRITIGIIDDAGFSVDYGAADPYAL